MINFCVSLYLFDMTLTKENQNGCSEFGERWFFAVHSETVSKYPSNPNFDNLPYRNSDQNHSNFRNWISFSWSPISAEQALCVEMEKLNIPFIPI